MKTSHLQTNQAKKCMHVQVDVAKINKFLQNNLRIHKKNQTLYIIPYFHIKAKISNLPILNQTRTTLYI